MYLYGGTNGANFDLRGDPSYADQSFVELESSDYDSSPNSVQLGYYGVSGLGTTLGFSNSKLGMLMFNETSTVLIGTTNTTPLRFVVNYGDVMTLTSTGVLHPSTSDAGSLGSTTKMWSDLFLASGAVVNFNNGNATLTHSAGLLTSNVDIVVPDEAYDATAWNGSLEVPTKNAVRDKIESLSGGVSDGDKGDITVSASGATWTIDNGVVSLAKQADVATATVFYRKTAGTGAPEVQTLATLKTDLGLTGTNSGDQTSIVGISGTKAQFDTACSDGNFLYSGDVTQYTDEMAQDAIGAMIDASLTYVDATPLLQRAALTGDVTASAGSNTTTIANDAVTYAKMQNVSATDKLLGRSTAGAGDVEEITCTAAGRALLDDTTAGNQRTTLGLGSIATQNASDLAGTFTAGGLSLRDSGGTYSVNVTVAENTADRTLSLDMNDGSHTLFLGGNLNVDAAASVTGTNTGDQNIFSTIAVSGQSNVVADTTSDTLTLAAGSNVTITTNATTDTITIAASGGAGMTWTEVTGTSQSAATDNGYIANNASLVTITIPTTAAVGKVVRIVGSGAGGWKIAQNASEIIHFGNQDTTTGTGGYLASTHRYDSVDLICIVADTEWVVTSSIGNITIV
jgi:hypothetical protein